MTIKTRKLDMSGADGYAITDADIVLEAVRQDKLDKKELIYSGLEGGKKEVLLRHGTLYPKSNYIFATTAPDLDETSEIFGFSTTTPLGCASSAKIPIMAVYDLSKFRREYENKYVFLNSKNKLEALLAVYTLENW